MFFNKSSNLELTQMTHRRQRQDPVGLVPSTPTDRNHLTESQRQDCCQNPEGKGSEADFGQPPAGPFRRSRLAGSGPVSSPRWLAGKPASSEGSGWPWVKWELLAGGKASCTP